MDNLDHLARSLTGHIRLLHRGEDRAASAAHLMKYLGLSNDRDLRTIIRHARLELGEPIVSTFDGGYSWPIGWGDDAYRHCIAQRRDVARDNHEVADAIDSGMERYFGEQRLFYLEEVS